MSRIAKRYAKALFKLNGGDLVKAKSERDALIGLNELFKIDESARVLLSPVMPKELKKNLLSYGLKQVAASDDVKRLIDGIVDAGRVTFLPEIAQVYAEFIDEAEGIAQATVVSAVALSAAENQDISSALAQMLQKKIVLKSSINSALLGGFVVRVGNYLVDLSLKSKLDGLAKGAVQESFVKGIPS